MFSVKRYNIINRKMIYILYFLLITYRCNCHTANRRYSEDTVLTVQNGLKYEASRSWLLFYSTSFFSCDRKNDCRVTTPVLCVDSKRRQKYCCLQSNFSLYKLAPLKLPSRHNKNPFGQSNKQFCCVRER